MKPRELIDYLYDIKDAMNKAEIFLGEMDLDTLKKDDRTIYAVIRTLEIMGEAAKKIPADIRDKYPRIPWRELCAIRDKVIHNYFGVDLDVIYKTITEDIPEVKPFINEMINSLEEQEKEG
jgi:uncharacterized protein with HEPN domain